MQNLKKPIFLILILVLPILVFVFLQTFGTNRYKLPVFYPQGTKQVLKNGKEVTDTIYYKVPDFSLKDQDNKVFDSKSLSGKIYVLDFFFTRCGNPDLCPRMSSAMARVQEMFQEEPSIEMLSISVDPQYDQPEVLKNYAKEYKAIAGKWHFLTGDKKYIYDLAQKKFFVSAGQESESITPEFLHATKFILVDRAGRIRGYYNGVDKEEIDKLILEIKILLKEDANEYL